jgi:polar amino acid transport system substrate-binding protein
VKIAVAQGSAPHTVLRRLIKNAEIIPVPGGFEPAREALATGKADVYGENLHLEHVPPQLNQGDSRGAEDGRGYRH